ncbi:MAG: ATP-binding protein [Terracidiphilus sp.]|jgi:signal transduction histidine kinase
MRMRTILLVALLSLACGLTVMSLAVIHGVLQQQIRDNLVAGLSGSTNTFQNLQRQRQQSLDREVALLADLPVLKALMTTHDVRTIQDGGTDFWRISGSDLFALIDTSGNLAAVYSRTDLLDRRDLELQLGRLLGAPSFERYLLTNRHLYQVSLHPLIFGPDATGTPLGYVVIGYAIDDRVGREVREAADADVVFLAADQIVFSTLNPSMTEGFHQPQAALDSQSSPIDLELGKEHYLAASLTLPALSELPVRLLVLKSFDQASTFAFQLNRLLLAIGALVLLLGTVLALYIAGTITRPLETLLAGARAVGSGNFDYEFTLRGSRELRELGAAFDQMRNQVRLSQRQQVESARLAIIGRMASSISHDLRHYLSAVYANAEFLSHSAVSEPERNELMAEVKLAVQGMTDILESLLIFSRTGTSLNPSYESLNLLIERAVALLRMHPDALQVDIELAAGPHIEAWLDARMIERAIYNLLINAVQAARSGVRSPRVRIRLTEGPSQIELRIVDNGPGVAPAIRDTLFEPFVSKGKGRGIGLGLSIASRNVQDHGGSVRLEQSEPGSTTFVLSLDRRVLDSLRPAMQEEPAILP